MRVFPDAYYAGSWACLVPVNNESARKRKSNRTRKGNGWLRRALCQSAWAVAQKKECYLRTHFYRRVARHSPKKPVVATSRQILMIVYHIFHDGTLYRKQGADCFDRIFPARTTQRLTRRLKRLGFEVLLKPLSPVRFTADPCTQTPREPQQMRSAWNSL